MMELVGHASERRREIVGSVKLEISATRFVRQQLQTRIWSGTGAPWSARPDVTGRIAASTTGHARRWR